MVQGIIAIGRQIIGVVRGMIRIAPGTTAVVRRISAIIPGMIRMLRRISAVIPQIIAIVRTMIAAILGTILAFGGMRVESVYGDAFGHVFERAGSQKLGFFVAKLAQL